MDFLYEYRTSDNEKRSGTVSAADRDAAYAALKRGGVRPSRLVEAPGFLNRLFGRGKRWLAIGILCVLCLALCAVIVLSPRAGRGTPDVSCDRMQLYGDPVVIRECEEAGWTNVFAAPLDCHLARYAIPGRRVARIPFAAVGDPDLSPVAIAADDLVEIAQMKRMVNGLKRELAEYLADGGSLVKYLDRLDIRQRAERRILEAAQTEVRRARNPAKWKAKNAELRAMGLPMVETDAEDE